MKLNRDSLEEYIYPYFSIVIESREKTEELYDSVKKFDYPDARCSDVISKRISLSEVTEFELFILTTGLIKSVKMRNIVKTYFTEEEIKYYNGEKWKTEKPIEFPLRFVMIGIADDQWIGRITAKELIKLRNAGLIRYNENIQRTMKKIVKGDTIEWRITENKRATKEIRESMENGSFISNTITLNIPDDGYSDFYYNQNSMELIIRDVKSLDIIDGFHRMIALEQAGNIDSNFDYPMELRISNYSEDKGQRFVFQEDQKTKMKKVDSNSFNVENEAVKTVRRLNENTLFNLHGEINRNKGLISLGEMSAIIEKLYFKNIGKQKARILGVELAKQLCSDFNLLTEYDTKFLTTKYDYKTLLIVLMAFDYANNHNIEGKQKAEFVTKALKNSDQIDQRRFKGKVLSSVTIKKITEYFDNIK